MDQKGIYYILNILNNKIYIGSSVHMKRRFKEHKRMLNNNEHFNNHLQKAWNKYGESSFEFGIIEVLEDTIELEEIREIEERYIEYFESFNPNVGYNLSKYAEGSGGYEISEETRRKLSEKATGRKVSEETRKKLSEAKKGELNPFFGKKHSEESKIKIGKNKIGKKPNENQLKALELGRGTKAYTEETYQKLREAKQGEKSSSAKLTETNILQLLVELKNGVPYKELSEKYNISIAQISRIKNKKRWGYLYELYPELYA